ncbi:MAG: Ran-binding domain [Marteilia pararefringens]
MPKNPIKLKIMSDIEITWASVDFTNDTDGSIQKSMIKFDNNDELVKFVEHFARHQHVEVSEVIEDSDMKLSLGRNDVVTDQDVMKSLERACEEKSSDANSKTSDADNLQADEVSQNISQASVGTNQQIIVSESSEEGQLKSNEPTTIDIVSLGPLDANEKSHETSPLKNEPAEQPPFNFSFSPKPTNLIFGKPNDKVVSNLFSKTASPSPSPNVTETKQNTPSFANLFGNKTGEASSKDIKSIFQQPPGGASIFSSNSTNKNETKPNEETKTTFQFNRFANSKSDNNAEPNQDPSADKKDTIKQIDTETLPEIEREKLEETIGDVIFHSKAKLFRFNPDHVEWKQKGTGVFKVVVPHDKKGQGIVQFMLRREPMMMLSINCFITKDTSLDDLGKSALMTQFVASDYSTGECVDSLFSVKLPTKEIVKTFRETVRNVTNNPN